ncbi:MAG: bifunctional chorismate mutase/prephenate dehydratase [Anaerovoracaceae bacterium]
MSLNNIREEIDNIDKQLVDLFVKRMDMAKKVAEEKKAAGSPVLNVQREREILTRVSEQAGEELDGYVRLLYNTIFDISRSHQNRIIHKDSPIKEKIEAALKNTPAMFPSKATVACQGVEGAYSQLAAEKLFAVPSIMYFQNFESVFNAVAKGLCRYGILPIENSSHGSVGEVYDLMKHYNFHIAKCIKLRISHKLLAKPGTKLEDITEIVSHEQALGQCADFIKSLKGVKITVCENTAVAAETVAASGRNDIAAISSADCARLYGLSVIRDDIQISDNNYTRFICISKDLEIYPGANKISLMLSLPHRPMSLYNMLARFSTLGLNLTKLESRPIPGSDFEFMFYFDMEASVVSSDVVSLLGELSDQPELFVFLGNYIEN